MISFCYIFPETKIELDFGHADPVLPKKRVLKDQRNILPTKKYTRGNQAPFLTKENNKGIP